MAQCNSIQLHFCLCIHGTAGVQEADKNNKKTKQQSQSPDELWLNDSIIPYLDYLQHLHSGDFAVTIQVIHVKGPVEFLLKAATGCDGQSADELSEINGSVSVFIKGSEGVLCKF